MEAAEPEAQQAEEEGGLKDGVQYVGGSAGAGEAERKQRIVEEKEEQQQTTDPALLCGDKSIIIKSIRRGHRLSGFGPSVVLEDLHKSDI